MNCVEQLMKRGEERGITKLEIELPAGLKNE